MKVKSLANGDIVVTFAGHDKLGVMERMAAARKLEQSILRHDQAIALLRDCPIKYFDFSGYEGEGAEWLRKREAYLEGGDGGP